MTAILVTGASGQLGSELRERSARYSGYNFVFTDAGEMDITDAGATAAFIADLSPSWVINCAAYTAVDKAEEEEELATLINGKGVENIVN
ncbi:MAG: sugar nucleotide-binding protein, partial [Bacteroidales bacterium]